MKAAISQKGGEIRRKWNFRETQFSKIVIDNASEQGKVKVWKPKP